MASELATRFLVPEEYARWVALVEKSPDGSVYSLPEYLDTLCAVAGGQYGVLVAERGGKLQGGIALYERDSRMGTYVAPRRLLYYNGIALAPHETTYPSQRTSRQLQTLSALEHALAALPHARVRFKSRSTLGDARVFLSAHWSVQPTYTYVVDLDDLPTAWARVDKNQRRLVGRCVEQGVEMTMDDDFDPFYRLHEQTHERKGGPLYLPRDAFRLFVERLRERSMCRLYHARLPDGRVVASQLVLVSAHPVTHTVCCGADAEFLSLGASAFLRWKVFEDLAHAGYKANDLTDAELNPVTRFKSQLGGDLALCLEITRPDRWRWRTGEFVASMPRRAKSLASRVLHRGADGKRS